MQVARTAEEARQYALYCAALVDGAQTAEERRFYRHLYDSWVKIANHRELEEAVQASNAVQVSWVERG